MNDNVYAESLFKTLKTEYLAVIYFGSDLELRSQLRWCLDIYYNKLRRHIALGFKTPDEYERLSL